MLHVLYAALYISYLECCGLVHIFQESSKTFIDSTTWYAVLNI